MTKRPCIASDTICGLQDKSLRALEKYQQIKHTYVQL
jgi:hypothetical protein